MEEAAGSDIGALPSLAFKDRCSGEGGKWVYNNIAHPIFIQVREMDGGINILRPYLRHIHESSSTAKILHANAHKYVHPI